MIYWVYWVKQYILLNQFCLQTFFYCGYLKLKKIIHMAYIIVLLDELWVLAYLKLWKWLHYCLKLLSHDHITVAHVGLSDIFLVSPQALATWTYMLSLLAVSCASLHPGCFLPNKNPSLLLYNLSSSVQIPSSLRSIPITCSIYCVTLNSSTHWFTEKIIKMVQW